MRGLEFRQRTNSDVWIHHVGGSFPDFFISLRHYTVIGKQLLLSNNRNRVRWAVLCLSQDGACTDLFENLSVNSLKGDLSNATTFKLPLFSLDNTFKLLFVNFVNCLWSILYDFFFWLKVNARNAKGETALHLAAGAQVLKFLSIIW